MAFAPDPWIAHAVVARGFDVVGPSPPRPTPARRRAGRSSRSTARTRSACCARCTSGASGATAPPACSVCARTGRPDVARPGRGRLRRRGGGRAARPAAGDDAGRSPRASLAPAGRRRGARRAARRARAGAGSAARGAEPRPRPLALPAEPARPGVPLPSAVSPAGRAGAARRRGAVYFTLGTVFNLESGDLFARVVAGLRELGVEVIVTVGDGIDPAELGPQPPHVRVERARRPAAACSRAARPSSRTPARAACSARWRTGSRRCCCRSAPTSRTTRDRCAAARRRARARPADRHAGRGARRRHRGPRAAALPARRRAPARRARAAARARARGRAAQANWRSGHAGVDQQAPDLLLVDDLDAELLGLGGLGRAHVGAR